MDSVIDQFAANAKETLDFLMNSDNQMPACYDWIDMYNVFVGFLVDCQNISQKQYYKWLADDEYQSRQEEYYNRHISNIEKMMEAITSSQKDLGGKIFKKN